MRTKPTETEVHEIRTLCALREMLTHQNIAALYGVSEGCVDKIAAGKRRAGIEGEEMTMAEARDYFFGYVR